MRGMRWPDDDPHLQTTLDRRLAHSTRTNHGEQTGATVRYQPVCGEPVATPQAIPAENVQAVTQPTISISRVAGTPGLLLAKPTTFMERPVFDRFREAMYAVRGAYSREKSGITFTLPRLMEAITKLQEYEFEVALAEGLRSGIEAAAQAQQEQLQAVDAVTQRADAHAAACGRTLFPYQRTGIRWLAGRPAALLGDEMGIGKTVQALLAAPETAPVVVVCPAGVVPSWQAEIAMWRKDLKVRVHRGTDPRLWRWPAAGEAVVLGYSMLPEIEDGFVLPPAPEGVVLIADEAHNLKSAKAQRTKKFRVLRDAVIRASGRVWALTGTPILNRPDELWQVLEVAKLGGEAFGSWPSFTALFGGKKGRFGMTYDQGKVDPSVPDRLRKVMLARRRHEVLPDLPTKLRTDRFVELDPDTAKLCDELVARLEAAGLTIDDLLDGGSGQALAFDLFSRVRAATAAGKVGAAIEVADEFEEAGRPLVVFCAHTEPLRVLAKRDGWSLIDGSVPAHERGQIVERWQRGELKGLACSYGAAGVGITLTSGCDMLHIDLPWTPASVSQAEDRINRIGQKCACNYIRLVADHPMERHVVALLTKKIELIEKSVHAAATDALGARLSEDEKKAALEAQNAMAVIASTRTAEAHEMDRDELLEMLKKRDGRLPQLWKPDVPSKEGKRPHANIQEMECSDIFVLLSGMDVGRLAMRMGGVTFGDSDWEFGRSVGNQLVRWGRLSNLQWASVVRIGERYRKYVVQAALSNNITLDFMRRPDAEPRL